MIFESKLPDIDLPNVSLAELVLEKADRLADKLAIVDAVSGRELRFGELKKQVSHLAAGLHQRGFVKGDVLAIFCPNLPEYAVTFLGVAAVGGINTTVNSLYSTRELVHQLKDSNARFMVTVPPFLDRARAAAEEAGVEEIFVIGEAQGCTPFAELLQNDGIAPTVAIDPQNDLVALPYSSGTTGLSKGVMLTHSNLSSNMILSGIPNPTTEDDVMVGVLPFFHIYGMVLILNLAIYSGITLVTMPRFDLQQFLEAVQKYKISILNLVPPLVLAMAKQPMIDDYDLSSVRVIGCGAAPLGEDMEKAVTQRLGCEIYQGYGLTEVAGASHVNPSEGVSGKTGSVGPTLPNTKAKLVDTETGETLGVNQRGEVWIAGPHVMTGYLNNVEATANSLDDEGWFHTGDIGYADEDGYFYIVDRLKELIKFKGYQVPPAELEALLLTHPAIADAAVIPSEDEEAGEVPKAYVVLKAEATAEEIMGFVADNVAPHKKIRSLEFTDEIPKSAAGKILRRVLVEQDRAS